MSGILVKIREMSGKESCQSKLAKKCSKIAEMGFLVSVISISYLVLCQLFFAAVFVAEF